jgi:hypothetical protein
MQDARQFNPKPIFIEKIPIIGEVPMVFYLPDAKTDEGNRLKILIEKYGGITTDFHECFTYQIEPLKVKLHPRYYFHGEIYSARWIVDSVQQGVLLDKSLFF